LFDCDSRRKTRINSGMSDGALSIVYSPDAESLAIGGSNSVLMWDSNKQTKRFEVSAQWARGVAFSPDGRVLTVAGQDGIRSWNADTGQPIQGRVRERPASFLVLLTVFFFATREDFFGADAQLF